MENSAHFRVEIYSVFERGSRKAPEVNEEQVKDLHAKIGGLAVATIFWPESSSPGPASEAQDD